MSLKGQTVKGLFWSIGERAVTQGSLFIISLVLARILGPTKYGIVAMLLVFINIADVFVTNGLAEALIQKNDASERDYATVFTSGLFLSFILYVILFICAPLIAAFYGDESMVMLLRVLGLRLPCSSMNAIQRAYVSKGLKFKEFFIGSSAGAISAGIIGICLAYFGAGTYALVIQQILNMLISTVILVKVTHWHPRFGFSIGSARSVLPIGAQLSLANLINVLYTEGRALIIGKFYSSDALAYYNRGNQFPSLIIGNINAPISNVMLPIMSKVSADKVKLKAAVRRSMRISAYLLFPCMGFLIAAAEPLVKVLLSDAWINSVPFLQLASLFYLFQPMQTMNWQALKAAGRCDLCLKLEIIKKIICFVFLFVSIPFGVKAIAFASVIAGVLSMLINMAPNGRVIGYSMIEQLKDLIAPLILTVFASVPIILINDLFSSIPAIVILLIDAFLGCFIYVIISILIKNDSFYFIFNSIKVKFKRKYNE